MKRRPIVLAAFVILALPAVCSAIPPRPGPYVSGFAGVSAPVNGDATTTSFAGSNSVITFNDQLHFDPNINIGGTAGFDFGTVRLEGEVSYKQGDISSVTAQNAQFVTQYTNTDGNLGALAMMFNAFIDLHNNSPFTPYFGGGIGFASLHLSDTTGTVSGAGGQQVYFDDYSTVFAYQVGAGLEVALNRQLSLDLAYRYFGTSSGDFNGTPISTNPKFESHNGSVGIRVKF